MTQVVLLSFRRNKFLVSLLRSIKSIVFVSGRISPHSFGMFSISPLQAYSFRCWFSNNSVITFLEGCFPSSIAAEDGIFLSILSFQWYIFYFFLPEALWCCSPQPIFLFCQDRVHSFCLSIQPGCCALCSSYFLLIKFHITSQPECRLKSFLPLVPFFQ